MRRKFVSALLLGGALTVASTGMFVSCEDYDDDINALRDQITSNATNLEQLVNEKVNNLTIEINALKEQDKALAAALETAKADLQAAIDKKADKTEVEALATRVATLEAAMKQVQEAQTRLQQAVDAANAKIAELEGGVATNEKAIEALVEADKALQAGIDAAKADAKAAQTLAEEAKGVADNNSKLIADLDKVVKDLQEVDKGLQNQVNVLKKDLVKVNEIVNANKAELDTQIERLENLINGDTPDGSLQKQLDALKAQYVELQKKHEADMKKAKEATDKQYEEIKKLINDGDKDLETSLDALKAEVTKLDSRVTEVEKAAMANADAIVNLRAQLGDAIQCLSKQLKALVFSPEAYSNGIETIPVNSFSYNEITNILKADLEVDQTKLEKLNVATSAYSVAPEVTASYFLNPSNASIKTDVANFAFLVNNAEVLTRGTNAGNLKVTKVAHKDGKVTVNFNVKDAQNIADGTNKVDVIALRYTDKKQGEAAEDTVITSDFAALKEFKYTDLQINLADAEGSTTGKCNHLPQTMSEATAAGASRLKVRYDKGHNTINLDKWINAHHSMTAKANDTFWGYQNDINKDGFKFEYELVGFLSGGNKTNESKHAKLEGSILTAQDVNGEQGGRKIIGRTPLVRVILRDTISNKVADVAYVLVEIVDKNAGAIVAPNPDALTDIFTAQCDKDKPVLNKAAVNWKYIEDKVLGLVDMSREEFDQNYVLATDKNLKDAIQFTQKGNEFVPLAANQYVGSVTATTLDDEAHQTEVLHWAVSNQQAYEIFVTGKKETVSTWVKFQAKNASAHAMPDVMVKLTWTPEVVNKKPEATILDSDEHKKRADWHKRNSREAGWEDLHVQVGNATYANATCAFENMVVADRFNKSPEQIIKDAIMKPYESLAGVVDVQYLFAEEQSVKTYTDQAGKTHTVAVSIDRKTISSDSQTLATINPQNGEITMADNDVVKAIINNHNYGELSKALDFRIEIVPTLCEPVANNILTLHGNDLNVKVIKPLYLMGGSIESMNLNDANSLTKELKVEFKDFNGYNPKTFQDKSAGDLKLYNFYGVKNERILEDKIETTYYKNIWTKYDKNNPDFSVTWNKMDGGWAQPDGAVSVLKITVAQKTGQSRANSFKIKLPFAVDYKWGTLYTTVELTVNAASGQAAKK